MRWLVIILVIVGCAEARESPSPETSPAAPETTAAEPTPSRADTSEAALLALADSAVTALRDKDGQTLAALVHPRQGLRFAPYASIDTAQHVVFTPDEVAHLATDTTTYMWGHADGTGDPIRTTFADYYDEFVYDQEFAEAQQGQPDERLGQGNTLNNIAEAFGLDARFVEYYVPGTEEYGGLDWNSLRLVFAPYKGRWRLVGVVHDEWTI